MRSVRTLVGAGAVALLSTAAWAFPWDTDMVDAYFFRAYEWSMADLPEDTVSRNMYVENANRFTPEGDGLVNPYGADDAAVKTGERMFEIYCATCHGPQGLGGAEVTRNDAANGVKRYPIPAPMLSGPGSVAALRSDGYIYLTIRNGGALMPSYGTAMDDDEQWAVVSYIRTLEGGQYNKPSAN